MARRGWKIRTPFWVVASSCLALACTGVIGGEDITRDGVSPPGTAGGAGLAEDPGSKDMHRLNTAEYNATIADVLGTALQPANASWRQSELGGFDNMAAVLGIDDAQYERYYTASEQLAADVFAAPALKARIVTCATPDDAACVQSIISATGQRIFRRPLTPEEVGTYQKVYAGARLIGDDHEGSLRLVLQALLASAEFLYRIEFDENPASNQPHPVSAYELASRVSYFLWSSAPDDALLQSAADGSILADAGLGAAVDRMLADGRAQRLIENFTGQWLGGRAVRDHAVDVTIFPTWTPDVAAAATRELNEYFAEFLLRDRSWLDFLKADVNFIEGALAEIYGVTPPTSMTRMELTSDSRFGFFGLSGFLAMSSMSKRTSPTLRGRWVLINLLCTHPDAPPPDVPELEETSPDTATTSVRDILERHRADARCNSCHSVLDPYGLALEQFDGIGRFRATYPDGSAIDPATDLPPSEAYPQGVSFSGLNGLADAVAQNPRFNQCVTEKLFTYGLGRVPAETDRPYLASIEEEWLRTGQPPTLRRLIRGLVLADTFRLRRGELAK
jgi:hypothetical protein